MRDMSHEIVNADYQPAKQRALELYEQFMSKLELCFMDTLELNNPGTENLVKVYEAM
jgi:hypothetical protein